MCRFQLRRLVFWLVLIVLPGLAPAQSLDLTITDPDEIAAQCGGTADAGERLFASCSACHAVQADAATPLDAGPHLQSLFGRVAASVDGFAYGAGLRQMNAAGTIWERETLHAYLADPSASPAHPAVGDEQERRDILTYLRSATLPPPPAPGEMVIPDTVFALQGDRAYGEYLAGECAGCHQTGAGAVPAIAGRDRRAFITAMHEYRARARDNAVMQMVARRLTDEEIAALAAYYEAPE